ncbi:hypothetical protein AYO38_01580 [bacterium SCGC AG-212-C10]|nr:hypothetical protein AYO38_01580 [bacterium SCGC AG-212-C10]
MANPLLTIVFDLFLIGSATVVVGAMIREYLSTRTASVGHRTTVFSVRTSRRAATVRAARARSQAARLQSSGTSAIRTRPNYGRRGAVVH